MMLISLIVFQLSIGVYSQEDYYDIQGYTTPGYSGIDEGSYTPEKYENGDEVQRALTAFEIYELFIHIKLKDDMQQEKIDELHKAVTLLRGVVSKIEKKQDQQQKLLVQQRQEITILKEENTYFKKEVNDNIMKLEKIQKEIACIPGIKKSIEKQQTLLAVQEKEITNLKNTVSQLQSCCQKVGGLERDISIFVNDVKRLEKIETNVEYKFKQQFTQLRQDITPITIHGQDIDILKKVLSGPLVDCSRTARTPKSQKKGGILNYDECFVDTSKGAMNKITGTFTTPSDQNGIYQISITMKICGKRDWKSHKEGGVWADIYVNDKIVADIERSQRSDKKQCTTHSQFLSYQLKTDDKVYVKWQSFRKDCLNNYISSDSDHDVHFNIQKIPHFH